jgi:DNA-binding NtrC family response regulator/predicted hydrocarbon binding protein
MTLIAESTDDRALVGHLHFSPDTGHIQLFDQRMLLMHGFSVAALRNEIIERLGQDKAREIFTRLGYQQGMADSGCLRMREGDDPGRILALGPRLREIEGFVRNQAIERMQFNAQTGEFWGDYYWQASWEAEAHQSYFGVGGEPACWMMIGYACGFTTALMGRPILWRETECVAMGHARCRVVGRPLEEWEDAADDLRFLQMEDFVSPPRPVRAQPFTPPPVTADALPDLAGASAPFNAVVHKITRVAATDATVLFLGESGVGKERFTKTLHAISRRAGGPLVSLNCAAIPAELVESELFGVEKGAYTGATTSRPGKFERAEGGTIFLDEITSLPLAAQGKLLRVLQEREVERVGDVRVRKVNVRVVAAANKDLRAEVAAGRFREDLFFRLNVFPIEIPPLRERREDIPLLVNVFVKRFTERLGKPIAGLTQRASEALWTYGWPGNVRELENMIERAVILADEGGTLDVRHLFSGGETLPQRVLHLDDGGHLDADAAPPAQEGDGMAALLARAGSLERLEAQMLDYALKCSDGNISAAARLLKLRRGQLEYRLKKTRHHP